MTVLCVRRRETSCWLAMLPDLWINGRGQHWPGGMDPGNWRRDCIVKSEQQGNKVESHYLQAMKPVLSVVEKMHSSYIERQAQLEQGNDDVIFQSAVRFLQKAIK